MLSGAQNLREEERYLVCGYYRSNHDHVCITGTEIPILTMLYLFVLDEFQSTIYAPKVLIKDINKCIVQCMIGIDDCFDEENKVYQYQYQYIFGRNIISRNNSKQKKK
eukprot:243542_1